MPFMAPAVPTGMKAGVRTTPCGVVSRPVRACAVGREQFEMIGKAHAPAYRVTTASVFNLVEPSFCVAKAVDAQPSLPHMVRAMMTTTKRTTKTAKPSGASGVVRA